MSKGQPPGKNATKLDYDTLVSSFEIGQASNGTAQAQAYLRTLGIAHLIGATAYRAADLDYLLLISATNTVAGGASAVLSGFSFVGNFEVSHNPVSAIATWANAQVAGCAAPATPAAPTVVTAVGSPGFAAVPLKITYVTASGESAASVASANSAVASAGSGLLVPSPVQNAEAATAYGVTATGWNVYLNGFLQNATPIAIGTSWTQTTALLTATAPPATVLKATVLQWMDISVHEDLTYATLIMS